MEKDDDSKERGAIYRLLERRRRATTSNCSLGRSLENGDDKQSQVRSDLRRTRVATAAIILGVANDDEAVSDS